MSVLSGPICLTLLRRPSFRLEHVAHDPTRCDIYLRWTCALRTTSCTRQLITILLRKLCLYYDPNCHFVSLFFLFRNDEHRTVVDVWNFFPFTETLLYSILSAPLDFFKFIYLLLLNILKASVFLLCLLIFFNMKTEFKNDRYAIYHTIFFIAFLF